MEKYLKDKLITTDAIDSFGLLGTGALLKDDMKGFERMVKRCSIATEDAVIPEYKDGNVNAGMIRSMDNSIYHAGKKMYKKAWEDATELLQHYRNAGDINAPLTREELVMLHACYTAIVYSLDPSWNGYSL